MKAKTKQGKSLQKFNALMGLIHLVQAVAMLFILNYSLKIPILTRFFDKTPSGGFTITTKMLVDVPVVVVAPVFLLISAFFHFLISSPFYVRRYEANIEKGYNPMRWVEYSISSSLMLVVLLMMGGLNELNSVVFVFVLNFIMNMWGLEMERYNQLSEKTKWFPYNMGVVAGITPWIIGGLYFWNSTNNVADSIPWYAQAGFIVTFLFFNSFAFNMLFQYLRIGPWKKYAFGERTYVWLSLIAKSSLAWILVLGTLNIKS